MENIRDYLLEHLFEVLAIIAAFLAPAIVSFVASRKKTKKMSYEILYENLIIASKKRFSELKFLYKEEEVDDLLLFVLRIVNNGKSPILTEDFESELEFAFGNNSKVLEVEIINKFPQNLVTQFKLDEDKALLTPTLFNVNDFIELVFLISNVSETAVSIQSRIKGISEIEKLSKRLPLISKIYNVFNFICFSSILMIFFVVIKLIVVPLSSIVIGSLLGFISISSIVYILHNRGNKFEFKGIV